MEILEAYDLTGSYRAAAELAGCDHHTVARYVQMRAAGQPPDRRRHRARAIDDFLPKIEELVVRSQGKVRADVIHERIVALGFTGGERTTRRTVAEAKAQFRAGRRRVYRPWVTEPGLWLQYDFGDGPTISGPEDDVVLRMVGVVAISGGDPDLGQDIADGGGVFGWRHSAAWAGFRSMSSPTTRRPRRSITWPGSPVPQSGDRGGGTALRHDAADVFTC